MPSPPKMPAPSERWKPIVSSTPAVAHRKPWRWIMYDWPGRTRTSMMLPGTLDAKATIACPPVLSYSFMNRPPPDSARPITPKKPLAPAVRADVCRRTLGDIHEKRPGSETMLSPCSKPISSTGSVVPEILDLIVFVLLWIDAWFALTLSYRQP